MALSKELEAKILRYHFVEKWRTGTIAKQLGIHHSVVDRVLAHAGLPKAERTKRVSMIDPFLPFIIKTLGDFPTLTAARLYDMAQARGYKGGPSHFRQRISELRPRPTPEAYLRLQTLPGEQAQVDWGHFGHIEIDSYKRPLMAFVMVLSWSRDIFLQFYLNQQMENFLRGHVAAFEHWQGIPRVCLYDNLKSAVLERLGDAIRFHPTLMALSGHYYFEPKAAAVARGNEKGRVERAIRYIRDNFFAGRHWTSLDDLNAQALHWCTTTSRARRCPGQQGMTVGEAFIEEQKQLQSLPEIPFNTREQVPVNAQKTPYIRFDLNDYSIPHQFVQKALLVSACLQTVRIIDGDTLIAQHQRCYGKGKQIEQEAHINALWLAKTNAKQHRGQHRLAQASSSCPELLQQAITRGHTLTSTVNALNQLLDDYGAMAFDKAIQEAMSAQSPYPQAVQQILERERDKRQQPPPISVAVPDKVKHLQVPPGKLSNYDQLTNDSEDDDDQ